MSQLDSYRNTLMRKREEAAKLSQDLAKEQAKLSPLQSKIISAKSAISRTKIKLQLNPDLATLIALTSQSLMCKKDW